MLLARSVCAADAPVALPVMLDGKSVGILSLHDRGGARYVRVGEALPVVIQLVRREQREAVAKALEVSDTWPLAEGRGGVVLTYNAANILLELKVPDALREPEDMRLNRTGVPNGRVVVPAAVSGFVNMYAADTHMGNMGMSSGRQPVHMDFDGALNVRGWVAEAQAAYTEASKWKGAEVVTSNRRLVHDDTDQMLRYQMGELTYPTAGLQRYRPMLGAGVARNFDLQPYRVTRPSGRADFSLQTASTVDVYVNGNRLQTLQLAAGTYTLSDFPVVNGANDVKLVLTDAAGRVETKTFPVVSDGDMLMRGMSSFTANAGVPQDNAHDGSGGLASGLWRYGLNDQVTVGANAQGDTQQQVVGAEASMVGWYGMLHADAAVSRDGMRDGVWDGALRMDYRNVAGLRGADSWQASAEYRGEMFNLPAGVLDNPYIFTLSGSYTKAWSDALNVTLGSQYRFGRNGQDDDMLLTSNVLWRLNRAWSVNVDGLLAQRNGLGVQVGLTWNPNAANTLTQSYDSKNRTLRADWLRRPADGVTGLDTDLAVTRRDDAYALAGTAGYTGERGQIRLRQEATTAGLDSQNNQARGTTTQLSVASALVYADGAWGVSRPVGNSFAIIDGPGRVGVNPKIEDPANEDDDTVQAAPKYEAQTARLGGKLGRKINGWLGAAVLPDLSPYIYRPVNVEVLPEKGTEVAVNTSTPEQMVLLPAYKSGTRVHMNVVARVTVRGLLLDAEGKPLALRAAQVRGEETPLGEIEPSAGDMAAAGRMVFTNREGKFSVQGLEKGHYVLALTGNGQHEVPFVVSDAKGGDVDLGELHVEMLAAREHSVMEMRR